jgi:hypothetical protein
MPHAARAVWHLVAAAAEGPLGRFAVAKRILDAAGDVALRRHHAQGCIPAVVRGPGGLNDLFRPRNRLKVLDHDAEEHRIRHNGGGGVEIALVSSPPECRPQIGELGA